MKKAIAMNGREEQMDDLISRQAAIDELADMHCKSDEDGYVWIIRSDAWARIDALPSAEQKAIRPKFVAEDRFIKNHFYMYPHCPKCNYELETGDCYCRVCGCHIDWSEDDE